MTTALPRSETDRRFQLLAYALGLAHLVFGATKLAALPPLVEQFRLWQLPPWMMTFVGVAQVLGGVGLFIRNLWIPSSLAMALVMIGGAVTVVATGHEVVNAPICIIIALLCLALFAHRMPQFAREFVAGEGAKAKPSS